MRRAGLEGHQGAATKYGVCRPPKRSDYCPGYSPPSRPSSVKSCERASRKSIAGMERIFFRCCSGCVCGLPCATALSGRIGAHAGSRSQQSWLISFCAAWRKRGRFGVSWTRRRCRRHAALVEIVRQSAAQSIHGFRCRSRVHHPTRTPVSKTGPPPPRHTGGMHGLKKSLVPGLAAWRRPAAPFRFASFPAT